MSEPTLVCAESVEYLATLKEASVDSIVCDPPYLIGFMGRGWDIVEARAAQAWHERWAVQALRVLKPGGHLIAFGGTRTQHRLVCALEDVGFEIRDQPLVWLYGQGFPKSLNVAKAIDEKLGVEPTVVRTEQRKHEPGNTLVGGGDARPVERDITAPTSDEAKEWDGWGTALKPAYEPAVLARKPLAGSVSENVLKHGTGAINIAGCAIETGPRPARDARSVQHESAGVYGDNLNGSLAVGETSEGRWPANVAFCHLEDCRLVGTGTVKRDGGGKTGDEASSPGFEGRWQGTTPLEPPEPEVVEMWECAPGCPVAELDRQSGESRSTIGTPQRGAGRPGVAGGSVQFGSLGGRTGPEYEDVGGASRFFFCAKASPFEKQAGLDELELRRFAQSSGGQTDVASGEERYGDNLGLNRVKLVRNDHPTVKAIDVMRWLTRMVTPPGGLCLDLFMGSGTTGIACALEGFRFLGIEQDEHFVEIARLRIAYWTRQGQIAAERGEDVSEFAKRIELVRGKTLSGQLGLLD